MKFFGPPIGLVLAVAGSLAAHFVAWGWFTLHVCDTNRQTMQWPADASPQGWACGATAQDLWEIPAIWGLSTSAILAVAWLVGVYGKGGSWRWAAPLPLLIAPIITVGVLALPPDTCTADARQTHTDYQCSTTDRGRGG